LVTQTTGWVDIARAILGTLRLMLPLVIGLSLGGLADAADHPSLQELTVVAVILGAPNGPVAVIEMRRTREQRLFSRR
jgi:hypothetical protein